MAYTQNDPLDNLDTVDNPQQKTRAEHLKDYAAMMTKSGLQPSAYEFSEYMKSIKPKKIEKDSIDFKDVTGQYHRIHKDTRKGRKITKEEVVPVVLKKKKKGGM
tara:strand:- start:923 stop:1234 length:312 start_codon:yes stop_codon:yes gene_type:complete